MDAGRPPLPVCYLPSPQVQSGLHLLSAVHAQLGPQVHPAQQPQVSAMGDPSFFPPSRHRPITLEPSHQDHTPRGHLASSRGRPVRRRLARGGAAVAAPAPPS